MLDNLFRGLFDSAGAAVITVDKFLLCVAVSLAIGACIAFSVSRKSRFTRSFISALTVLPALVCATIMMVNGNIGAGVATAGAFSLVRFRSGTGSAKEIALIFLSMAAGLIAGMGYLAYAALFALVLCGVLLALSLTDPEAKGLEKTLRITVPEDLNYCGVFDGILNVFCKKWSLEQVKTTNMGALYKLRYDITLRRGVQEKELIDQLRTRNGNLEISINYRETVESAL